MSSPAEPGWRDALDCLRERPSGLLTDIDGTLSPIAPTPDEAMVDPDAQAALGRLVPKVDIAAAITGRAPEYAARMVGLPGVVYVGNHGLQDLVGGQVETVPEAREYEGRAASIFAEARGMVDLQRVLWEDKGVTGSVHFRRSPDPDAAYRELRSVLAPLAERQGMELHDGRMVIEVRPKLRLGKGAAARRLVEKHDLRGCVFLGDDVTDTDAFRQLRELRGEGRLRAINVGVLSPETPAVVSELSDLTVEGVPGAAALLNWLAGSL